MPCFPRLVQLRIGRIFGCQVNNISFDTSGVFAIVITYNPKIDYLRRLAAELLTQVEQLIVVDNGSDNADDCAVLCGEQRYIQLIALPENMGIAQAQNIGCDAAKKSGAEFLVYFDQDSVISKQFVQPLKNAFLSLSKSHKVALVAPIFKDERHGFFYPLVFLNKYGLRRKVVPTGNEVQAIPISMAISSGTFTSVAVMDAVGGMRSDFFIDYVDIEWCLRAGRAGYSLFAIPGVCMLHSIGDRSIPFLKWRLVIHSEWRRYYRIRNGFFMLRLTHVPKILALREVLINVVHQAILLLTQKNKALQLKYFLRGVRDGCRPTDRA